MIHLRIDERDVEVPSGTTVLSAARSLGIDLPTLCYREGHPPNTTCMCCLVRVEGRAGPVPSCATPVEEGMRVECETRELHQLRRTGIELLLSDHIGDCHAPCQNTCPARMDIPNMLRLVAEGQYREAIATIKQDIALPATLGRVCPEVCERACRRAQLDRPAAICRLKQFVADRDLASGDPYHPESETPSDKHVAVVGAGPTGLTAAYHLLCKGHACTLIESAEDLGGRIRREFPAQQLPPEVLDAEIQVILDLGAQVRPSVRLGRHVTLAELRGSFDAVILAIGVLPSQADELGVDIKGSRIVVKQATRETSAAGVFAAGGAVRPNPLVVQSVAEGKLIAGVIDRYLRGETVAAAPRMFEVRRGRLSLDDVEQLRRGAGASEVQPGSTVPELTLEQMQHEAERCLHCDCSGLESCRLRHYADLYHCDPNRFRGTRRRIGPCLHHHEVSLEPGKCIACGICLQVAEELGEPIGLAFLGRGFEVRVDAPLDRSLDDALTRAASACAQACPTGAIAARQQLGRPCERMD